MTWRKLSAAEIERQFNPRHAVPDFAHYQEAKAQLSARTRAELTCHLDVAYGAGPRHRLDVFPAGAGAPVHLFLHGGYWRGQDKSGFSFVARPLVAQGICTIVVNYDLCPAVSLDGVVASARSAIAWVSHHARDFGADPARLTLSGSSAGAHLQAMALAHDWASEGLADDVIKGAVPISGIYDPTPAMATSVNAEIGLTVAIARRNDALALEPRVRCPVALFVGGAETAEWIRQSEFYARHLRRCGLPVRLKVVPGAHHFSILDGYLDPESVIVHAIVAQAHAV